ncbi:HAD family hydrolase [Enterococcus dongliensis]|uniref:HAD family hydrolase n=1 Tax=Enterococcus dongliensis TaxID=2559925 RepID=UPI00288D6CEE|nr:HAD family hydrolase [Enterococcus dongliensis]MDT2673834.1 HAD family hydrolase [Enterococcus dongliensis]
MERKLIALDIDGTLLSSQRKPLDSTVKALKALRQAGHLVIIATGRSRLLAGSVIHQLGCTNYIICNGSAAFLDHEQVYKHTLDREVLTRMIDFASERKVDIALFGLDSFARVTRFDEPKVLEAMGSFGQKAPDYEENYFSQHEVYQGCAFYDQSKDAEFEAAFPEFRLVRWHENSVDIIPNPGSKAQTILALAKRVGIKPENIVTFGDGNNDIEMLNLAGTGVAMGNAATHVKEAANLVTDTNDQDGIYKALRKLELVH